tara:strand:+ start:762 stop:1547 length:786 start_codon:yes stop_codon:yes gene_type:complete
MNIPSSNFTVKVNGVEVVEIPEDLFIPPDALQVILEQFEGPLDLLLYLIKKQNIDITDIQILPITNQYIEYINMMQRMQFELASDYLVMAATLAEIKSRMLIPNDTDDNEEDDPRADLIKRLMEYQKYKDLSSELDMIPRLNRDNFIASGIFNQLEKKQDLPKINIEELEQAFLDVMKRAEINASHEINTEVLSVRERMTRVLELLNNNPSTIFTDCFDVTEGKMGVVVTFLAILELVKENIIDLFQNEPLSVIYLKLKNE